MDGRATFTIVASRTIINMPTHSTESASQRLRSVVVSVVTFAGSLCFGFASYDYRSLENSSLGLPQGDLAPGAAVHDAPPARRALPGLEQHGRTEPAGPLGDGSEIRHLNIGKPHRTTSRALDHPSVDCPAQVERLIAAAAGPDGLSPPAKQLGIEAARVREVARVKLEVNQRCLGSLHQVVSLPTGAGSGTHRSAMSSSSRVRLLCRR